MPSRESQNQAEPPCRLADEETEARHGPAAGLRPSASGQLCGSLGPRPWLPLPGYGDARPTACAPPLRRPTRQVRLTPRVAPPTVCPLHPHGAALCVQWALLRAPAGAWPRAAFLDSPAGLKPRGSPASLVQAPTHARTAPCPAPSRPRARPRLVGSEVSPTGCPGVPSSCLPAHCHPGRLGITPTPQLRKRGLRDQGSPRVPVCQGQA